MKQRAHVTRDVCIIGLGSVHRSSAETLTRRRHAQVASIPLRREALYRFDGDEVLLATRQGRSLVGRLRVTERQIELRQMVAHLPCRHRLALEDIIACCLHDDDDAIWDIPTKPESLLAIAIRHQYARERERGRD